MKCRIAVVTDIHFSRVTSPERSRQTTLGAVLLRRTVERLNRFIKPDVTVLLGDLIDDPKAPDAADLLAELRGILEKLKCPWLAIPGNHDPGESEFFKIFPRLDHIDVKGVRLAAFVDREQPGHNASRSVKDLKQMAALSSGHHGPLIALQHVPAVEPRRQTPYGYTNHAEVIDAMRRHGYSLAISGHFHRGRELTHEEGVKTLVVPALCEKPFSYAIVAIDGDDVSVDLHRHELPAELNLNDYHSHTQYAYCGEDVGMTPSSAFAAAVGLNQLAFTEHSGQLYFEKKTYWQCGFGERGIHETSGRQLRMPDYWRDVTPYRGPSILAGLEIDGDFQGNLVVEQADFDRADIVVGAVHWLRALKSPSPDPAKANDEFLAAVHRLSSSGIDVLAHPFRVFGRAKVPVPESLFAPVVDILKRNNVAAEINYHTNEPEPPFFALCIRAGVRISFGSDAHALYEVGEFFPHLALLTDIGYNASISDILIPDPRK